MYYRRLKSSEEKWEECETLRLQLSVQDDYWMLVRVMNVFSACN